MLIICKVTSSHTIKGLSHWLRLNGANVRRDDTLDLKQWIPMELFTPGVINRSMTKQDFFPLSQLLYIWAYPSLCCCTKVWERWRCFKNQCEHRRKVFTTEKKMDFKCYHWCLRTDLFLHVFIPIIISIYFPLNYVIWRAWNRIQSAVFFPVCQLWARERIRSRAVNHIMINHNSCL